jgi:hypothetical protein
MISTTLTSSVLTKYKNPYFVETGTANGDCVKLALLHNFERIFSIEIDPILQKQNCLFFQPFINNQQVDLILGDSLIELKKLIPLIDKPTTFWLDAHVDYGPSGIKRCPLYEELEAIATSNIKTHTIMIDDMRCLGGGTWGTGISVDGLKNRLLKINSSYNFSFENGWAPNDILVAHI